MRPEPTRARARGALLAPGRRAAGSRDRLGEALTWLSGGALAANLLLVVGILGLLAYYGLAYFWQKPLVYLELADGERLLGEVWESEEAPAVAGAATAADTADTAAAERRTRLKVGNRDVGGADFVWVAEPEVVARARPAEAMVVERFEWGNFYGFPRALETPTGQTVTGDGPIRAALAPLLAERRRQRRALEALEDGRVDRLNRDFEELRLERRGLERQPARPGRSARLAEIDQRVAALEAEYEALAAELFRRREALAAGTLVMTTADGRNAEIELGEIVRVVRPNALSPWAKTRLYLERVWELLSADPRESNTEGGIFPAIFGTVMMVFLMTFAVAPLGVLAALYLREYATQGLMVRIVRIAVNNLAGVPSIVFGVFGLGFFVYLVGGTIDRLFYPEALPTPTYGTGGILWAALTLALLTVPVVIVATEEGLAAVPRIVREGSLALGATQLETTWRVVLPAAAPGILTGMILAMARAAGEVAPLMIVGMVKLAPSLPIDGVFPFVHPERKFMHLGFHIYDLGFQSPNVEAAEPLVFATALLLVVLVTVMNLAAIWLRNHLRRKYAGSAV